MTVEELHKLCRFQLFSEAEISILGLREHTHGQGKAVAHNGPGEKPSEYAMGSPARRTALSMARTQIEVG